MQKIIEEGVEIQMKKVNLYAFSYAFGGGNIYWETEMFLDNNINMIPLDYPGHESRYSEELLSSIQDMAEEAYNQICNKLNEEYSLLGYSMGGYVCYELYHIIKRNNKKLPTNIFLFATNEPEYKYKYMSGESMSLTQVKEILEEMGATSKEILNNDEVIEMVAPIVRKDISAIENYIPTSYMVGKIECPVTIVRGSKEKNENCQTEWNKYFESECEYIVIDGEHFFMFEDDGNHLKECVDIINKKINMCFTQN